MSYTHWPDLSDELFRPFTGSVSHKYMCICMCVYMCMYVCMYVYMCVCVYMCVYVYMYIYICMYMYECVYKHILFSYALRNLLHSVSICVVSKS